MLHPPGIFATITVQKGESQRSNGRYTRGLSAPGDLPFAVAYYLHWLMALRLYSHGNSVSHPQRTNNADPTTMNILQRRSVAI
jgi:hypothetical protein